MPTLLHRFGRFAVVGAIATATHAAVFAAAIEAAHVEPVLATALAFVVAMLTGFAVNGRWTLAVRDAPGQRRDRGMVEVEEIPADGEFGVEALQGEVEAAHATILR